MPATGRHNVGRYKCTCELRFFVGAGLSRPAVFLFALLGVLIAPAFAQNPPSPLAQEIVTQIAKLRASTNKKDHPKFRIAVIPFARDGKHTTQLGVEIAQNLAAELASAAPELEFASGREIDGALEREVLRPLDLTTDKVARWFGDTLDADLVITGSFRPKKDGVAIDASGVACRENTTTIHVRGLYSGTAEFRSRIMRDHFLTARSVPGMPAGVFKPGSGGVGDAGCLVCPDPIYPLAARAAKVQGNVPAQVVITPQGRATNIVVTRGLPFGLTGAAIEAIQGWKFNPALGPDGKPVPVWVTVEVTFRLFP